MSCFAIGGASDASDAPSLAAPPLGLATYPTTLGEDERQWRTQRRLRADAAVAAAGAASADEGNASSSGSGGGALVSRSTFLALRFRIAQKTTLRDALLWLGHASDLSGADGAGSALSEGDCDCSRAPTLAAAAAALESWLEASGAYTEPVRSVMVGQGMRLGLVTQRDGAVNDTIIAIPLRLVMDAASARSVPKIATVLDDLNVRCVSWSSTRLCAAARVRPSPRFALTRPRRHAPADRRSHGPRPIQRDGPHGVAERKHRGGV